MSIYRINPIGGSNGFKVHVVDDAGGLRVVGIFPTETDAEAWIATDRRQSGRAGQRRRVGADVAGLKHAVGMARAFRGPTHFVMGHLACACEGPATSWHVPE